MAKIHLRCGQIPPGQIPQGCWSGAAANEGWGLVLPRRRDAVATRWWCHLPRDRLRGERMTRAASAAASALDVWRQGSWVTYVQRGGGWTRQCAPQGHSPREVRTGTRWGGLRM